MPTAFHELTHSTGHASRLNRLERTAFFGSEAYSKEELIAEIGAAALGNAAGLETSSSFRNSAAYIQNWLKVLSNDKRFIITAAGKAEMAVNLILEAGHRKQHNHRLSERANRSHERGLHEDGRCLF